MTSIISFLGGIGNGTPIWVSSTNPLPTTVSGGSSPPPYEGTPLGYQQIAASGAVQTLTVPGGATYATVVVEGADARWRDDGVAPTTSIGMPIYSGTPTQFSGDLTTLKFIAQSSTSTYNISYYK